MIDADFLDLISGRRRGPVASLARMLLSAATVPYGLATEFRNFSFDVGWRPSRHADVPVLSVGNLTTGGTGKTPVVAWLVHELQKLGTRPGIVSRGYRSLDGAENDEKRLLNALCPDVPHVQHRRRLTAARQIVDQTKTNVIVLDDGFQHRSLFRDADLVLIDALNPWGYGSLLPRGLLRERIGQLHRADAILLTRCDLVDDELLQGIQTTIQRRTSRPIYRTVFAPTRLVRHGGETMPLSALTENQVQAFCGIGNPIGFRRLLSSLDAEVSGHRFLAFPDHHHYSQQDLKQIQAWAESRETELLVTTRKDLVKIPHDSLGSIPLAALDIQLQFLDDPQPLVEMIRAMTVRAGRKIQEDEDDSEAHPSDTSHSR